MMVSCNVVVSLSAEPVGPCYLQQVPVQYLPNHILCGECRGMEKAVQALRCPEAVSPCKATAHFLSPLCVLYRIYQTYTLI